MTPPQSTVILLVLVALAFSPRFVTWALQKDEQDRIAGEARHRKEALPDVLTPEQAYARHLYGESYSWEDGAMRDYDALPFVRKPWETVASSRILHI